MPDFRIRAGDTDATIYVRLRDSTTGLAKTGIAYDDAGAVCSYTLPLAARAAIPLATQTVTGAHADGGFVEVDAVNCKGLYRLDLTDAAVASGDYTIISIEFDGVIEESIHIPLAIEPTLFTMSAQLTTVASDTLAIEADTNELQGDWTNAGRLDAILDTIYSDTTVLETDWINGGRLDLILDTIASDTLAIEVDTSTTIPASLTIIASDTLAIEADTNELQGDWTNAGRLDAILDTIYSDTTHIDSDTTKLEISVSDVKSALVVADAIIDTIYSDTTILEADWINGGRLDLILDIIASDTLAIEAAQPAARISGTADSGTTGTMVDAARTEGDTDYFKGALIRFTSGTISGQTRLITAFNFTSNTITFTPVTTQAVATQTYEIIPFGDGNVLIDWLEAGRLDAILDTTYSDTTVIEAAGGSLTAAQASDLVAIESQLLVTDAVVDTIYSDTTHIHSETTALQGQATTIASDTLAIEADTNELQTDWANAGRLDAILDTIYSDTTVLEGYGDGSLTTAQDSKLTKVQSDMVVLDDAVSDVESCLVVVKSDIAEIYSDTTLIYSDTTVIEAAGGLTTAQDSKLTKVTSDVILIYSDTTALSAASNPPKIIGGWGYDGTSYFWNASLLIDGLIISSGVSAPAVVGVYGNNGETDLGYSEGTAPGVQTKHSVGGSFTLSTLPASGNPAYLEITLVYAAVTYTARLYAWGR